MPINIFEERMRERKKDTINNIESRFIQHFILRHIAFK